MLFLFFQIFDYFIVILFIRLFFVKFFLLAILWYEKICVSIYPKSFFHQSSSLMCFNSWSFLDRNLFFLFFHAISIMILRGSFLILSHIFKSLNFGFLMIFFLKNILKKIWSGKFFHVCFSYCLYFSTRFQLLVYCVYIISNALKISV